MILSAKIEYACLAMLDLAVMAAFDRPVQQRGMAERQGIPRQFLVQILQQLKAAGLVQSTRGSSGGYQLARPASEISLWDVVLAVRGEAERPPFEREESPAAQVLRGVWNQMAQGEQTILQEARLDQLAAGLRTGHEPMYFI